MSRILLADDSPHAQRMGELILRDEGYEVVTVTDGETALLRLADVDPDVILADALLPSRDGYEICRYVKSQPRYRHARVVLTAGALEPLDEAEAARLGADATVRKPFEASVLLQTVRSLVEAATQQRAAVAAQTLEEKPEESPSLEAADPAQAPPTSEPHPQVVAHAPVTSVSGPDAEEVRAAVTLALNEAFSEIADELAAKVVKYLQKA
ncbi:MAG: response regulator [Bryobacteraceae bacterium]|nr:response regulator [Bryobacteraceae bacterium]